MNNWDNRYAERVKLLVEILPTLAEEKRTGRLQQRRTYF